MFVRQQVSKLCPDNSAISYMSRRDDRFADLVRQVAADPHDPFNLDGYLWTLEEPTPRWCDACGDLFDPWFAYDGGPARGLPRRYCSPQCAGRAAELRRRRRLAALRTWGRAA